MEQVQILDEKGRDLEKDVFVVEIAEAMCRHGRQDASTCSELRWWRRRSIQSTFDAQLSLFCVVSCSCFDAQWPLNFRLVALELHIGRRLSFRI